MEDLLPVTELTETVMTVVSAYARGPGTAEWQFFLGDMHHHVLDRRAALPAFIEAKQLRTSR
jgi:hypothetical protein